MARLVRHQQAKALANGYAEPKLTESGFYSTGKEAVMKQVRIHLRFTLRTLLVVVPLLGIVVGLMGRRIVLKHAALEELAGTWETSLCEVNGEIIPVVLTFDGCSGTTQIGGSTPVAAAIDIDPTRSPKWMDIQLPVGPISKCIYKLTGNTLTIRQAHPGMPRPTSFDSGGEALLVCRQASKVPRMKTVQQSVPQSRVFR